MIALLASRNALLLAALGLLISIWLPAGDFSARLGITSTLLIIVSAASWFAKEWDK